MFLKRNLVVSGRETTFVLWLLTGCLIGTLSVIGLGAASVVAAVTLAFTFLIVASGALFKRFIFALLVSKPIIDLAWRWNLGMVMSQRLNLQTLVGVYVIVFVITAWLVRRHAVFSRPVVGLAGTACLSLLISALFASNGFSDGLNDFLRLISGLSLFFVVGYALCNERVFSRFAWWLVLTTTIPLVLSVLQLRGIVPYEYWDWIGGVRIGRLSGSYPHPLNLASYLVYGHLLALYLLNRSARREQRLILLAWMGLLYYVLYYTYHRTTYLVIALQLIGWLYLHKQWVFTFLVAVAGGAVALAQRGILKELYATLFVALSVPAGIFSQSFLRGRGEQWWRYLSDFIHSHPLYWLLGRGNALLASNYPEYVFSNNEPHNDFLRLLYTYGVLGLLSYLSILLAFLGIALQLTKMTARRFERDLAYLMLLSILSIAILSITVEPMRYPTSVWYLFALGSVVTVRYRQLRRTRPADSARSD
jgi:O-antigen ligase